MTFLWHPLSNSYLIGFSLLLKYLKERECFLEKNYSVTLLIGGGVVTEHASDITAAAVLDYNQCGRVVGNDVRADVID